MLLLPPATEADVDVAEAANLAPQLDFQSYQLADAGRVAVLREPKLRLVADDFGLWGEVEVLGVTC